MYTPSKWKERKEAEAITIRIETIKEFSINVFFLFLLLGTLFYFGGHLIAYLLKQ